MSVLQRFTGWLTGKGSPNAQTAYGGYNPRGYYGSAQAEDAYGSLSSTRSFDMSDDNYGQDINAPAEQASADPYNGRVPYRSQRDQYAQQENAYPQNAQQDLRHRRTDVQETPYAQQQQAYPQQPEGNVVNFPGQQGAAPTHVEYVILLRSRNECTKVIEYIKTNASVFLNMEYIANEGERQRCVDMLSGAAYTLGCQLHKISNRGIYLIASPNVRVMIDPAMKRFASTAEPQTYMQQQTGEVPPEPMQQARQPLAPPPPFAFGQSGQEGAATAPYPAQQQSAYTPFQRPRQSYQAQPQQAQPFRRASGTQYTGRQAQSYPSNY